MIGEVNFLDIDCFFIFWFLGDIFGDLYLLDFGVIFSDLILDDFICWDCEGITGCFGDIIYDLEERILRGDDFIEVGFDECVDCVLLLLRGDDFIEVGFEERVDCVLLSLRGVFGKLTGAVLVVAILVFIMIFDWCDRFEFIRGDKKLDCFGEFRERGE